MCCEAFNSKVYESLLEFKATEHVDWHGLFHVRCVSEIQFKSLTKSEAKCVANVFNFKAYDSMLEYKATEHVFSMSRHLIQNPSKKAKLNVLWNIQFESSW